MSADTKSITKKSKKRKKTGSCFRSKVGCPKENELSKYSRFELTDVSAPKKCV